LILHQKKFGKIDIMKLSQHIKQLQEVLEKEGDLECYTASDDEGNSYRKLCSNCWAGYTPELEYILESVFYPDDEDDYSIEELIEEGYVDSEKDLIKILIIN